MKEEKELAKLLMDPTNAKIERTSKQEREGLENEE